MPAPTWAGVFGMTRAIVLWSRPDSSVSIFRAGDDRNDDLTRIQRPRELLHDFPKDLRLHCQKDDIGGSAAANRLIRAVPTPKRSSNLRQTVRARMAGDDLAGVDQPRLSRPAIIDSAITPAPTNASPPAANSAIAPRLRSVNCPSCPWIAPNYSARHCQTRAQSDLCPNPAGRLGLDVTSDHDPSEIHVPNRLANEVSPYLHSTRTTRSTGIRGDRRRWRRRRREDKPILLSIGYSACHWCHVMEHESFEDDGDRRADERALRQHQGRPRRAPRPRPDLHERRAGDDRPRRLAADGLPDAGRHAVLRRHLLPADDAPRACRRFQRAAGAVADACRTESGRRRSSGEQIRRDRLRSDRRRQRPARRRSTSSCSSARDSALAAQFDRAHGGFGGAPKFPHPMDARVSAPLLHARTRRRRRAATMVAATLDKMAARRDLRSARRRLPPLRGRRALAGPALREDALRQRAARAARTSKRCQATGRRRATARDRRARRSTTSLREMTRAGGRLLLARRTPTARARRASSTSGRRTRSVAALSPEEAADRGGVLRRSEGGNFEGGRS